MIWLFLLLQPEAAVDELGTHVFFDVDINKDHIVDWDFWGTEITRFSDGTDLGSKKAGESSDASAYMSSLMNQTRVELVARKQAKSDVTVEGTFDMWISEELVEKRIERVKLENGSVLPIGEYEMTITSVTRKEGKVALTVEFSTLNEITLKFIKDLQCSVDGNEVKLRRASTQTSTYKSGKRDRYGHYLHWEITTDASEVTFSYKAFVNSVRKRIPFKVTAPLKEK